MVKKSPLLAVLTNDGTLPELSVAVGTVHSTTTAEESSGSTSAMLCGHPVMTGSVMSGPTVSARRKTLSVYIFASKGGSYIPSRANKLVAIEIC